MRRQELHPRTAIINKKQKNHSKLARLDALAWLAKKFPQAFDNRLRIRPLKIGIINDLLAFADEAKEEGISKSKLREAVVVFTRRIDYLATLKARESRIDLSGQVVGCVTDEEAEHAAMKIKRKVEKSAKNARKMQASKSPLPSSPVKSSMRATTAFETSTPSYYSELGTSANPSNVTSTPAKSATVVVKHKTSKQYDPNAVARLKEKLGLSFKKETQ